MQLGVAGVVVFVHGVVGGHNIAGFRCNNCYLVELGVTRGGGGYLYTGSLEVIICITGVTYNNCYLVHLGVIGVVVFVHGVVGGHNIAGVRCNYCYLVQLGVTGVVVYSWCNV